MPVTIRDIAEAADVSPTTVFCALNGHGRISPITAERLRQIAAEMRHRARQTIPDLVQDQGIPAAQTITSTG